MTGYAKSLFNAPVDFSPGNHRMGGIFWAGDHKGLFFRV